MVKETNVNVTNAIKPRWIVGDIRPVKGWLKDMLLLYCFDRFNYRSMKVMRPNLEGDPRHEQQLGDRQVTDAMKTNLEAIHAMRTD